MHLAGHLPTHLPIYDTFIYELKTLSKCLKDVSWLNAFGLWPFFPSSMLNEGPIEEGLKSVMRDGLHRLVRVFSSALAVLVNYLDQQFNNRRRLILTNAIGSWIPLRSSSVDPHTITVRSFMATRGNALTRGQAEHRCVVGASKFGTESDIRRPKNRRICLKIYYAKSLVA